MPIFTKQSIESTSRDMEARLSDRIERIGKYGLVNMRANTQEMKSLIGGVQSETLAGYQQLSQRLEEEAEDPCGWVCACNVYSVYEGVVVLRFCRSTFYLIRVLGGGALVSISAVFFGSGMVLLVYLQICFTL